MVLPPVVGDERLSSVRYRAAQTRIINATLPLFGEEPSPETRMRACCSRRHELSSTCLNLTDDSASVLGRRREACGYPPPP